MRCDDVPRLLAIGGALGRWWARRHAARCPRCEAFRSALDELAAVPPLPDSHRALWARAADEPETIRLTWSRFVRPVAAIVATAAMIGFVASDLVWRQVRPRPAPGGVPVERGPDLASVTIRNLDAMEESLGPLARELTDLRRHADLLDARRDVDRLLARYAWPERARGM